MLHNPALGKAWIEMAVAMAGIPGLTREARETAILVVGLRTGAAYEI